MVGFDVAGDEGSYPLSSTDDPMWSGVTRARDLRVPVTVHAGEWPEKYRTVENVRLFFFKWPFPASYSLFSSLFTADNKQMFYIKVCKGLDSNGGYLVPEETALPTKPQPLPIGSTYFYLTGLRTLSFF